MMQSRLQGLAQQLADAGVQHAFGVAGSGASWELISDLSARGVHYHPVGHEGAAAMMAGGVFQASGRLSVCISIKGPGLVNMAAGIAYNHFENLPVVSIAESYGRDVPSFRMHKRMDHGALVRGITKGWMSSEDAPTAWDSLLTLARAEVPGPVHIELGGTSGSRPAARPLVGESGDWRAIADRIGRARRPLVISGGLARRRAWGARLGKLQIPVLTTAAGRGAFDERSPCAGGVFTGEGRELAPETRMLAEADLIVALGLRNLEVVSPKKFPAPLALLDEVGPELGDGFEAEVRVAGASEEAFDTVLASLAAHRWGVDELQMSLQRMRDQLCNEDWLPARCFNQLDGLEWDHALVLDTGSFCTIGEHLWRVSEGRNFAGSNNGRFMGGGIPVAIGFAVAAPERPVFCVVGDGGMRMYPGELKLAVERQLPIAVIFCCDGRYGSIAAARQGSALSLAAVSFAQPSWVRAAEGLGCEAHQVHSEKEFTSALAAWNRKSPCFIEAVFDPERCLHMTRRLR